MAAEKRHIEHNISCTTVIKNINIFTITLFSVKWFTIFVISRDW